MARRQIMMARFGLALPIAGALAALLSALALALLSYGRGLVPWAAFNATTHAIHGPQAATTGQLDWSHTGLGLGIHVVSCFFWAAVAILFLRAASRGRLALAWLAGLGTALLALVIDYGLLPQRLSPGWHLVLPFRDVIAGFLALGVGLSLGLAAVHASAVRPRPLPPREPRPQGDIPTVDRPDAVQRLRHPAPDVIDQRQGRIDPADLVTEDPNRRGNGNKQPGGADPRERPDR